MGDFDALFGGGEPKKKKSGDFDALFGDHPAAKAPAKQAEPFPWETDTEGLTSDRVGRANREYAENLAALETAPRGPTGVVDNLKLAGSTIAGGAKALLGHIGKAQQANFAAIEAGQQPPNYLAEHPEARREIERGVSDTVTVGLAEKAARAVDPEHFGPEAAAADAVAAPGLRVGAGLAGAALPNPLGFVAGKVGGLVPGAGAVRGAGRSLLQYEATAPAAAAIQAEPGHRIEAAAQAATDPTGLILSGGMGAAGGAIARAPERVRERGVESVARGEAGGTANKRIARKATARAGEGGDNLYEQIGNDLPLEAAVSVFGKSHPGAVAKTFTRRLDRLAEETEPFYRAIDNAPDPRFANPANAPKNGGVDLGRVQADLEGAKDKALAEGRAIVAEAYDKALARLRAQYGTDGVIVAGEKLPSRSMRNYANELGDGLFSGEVDPKLRIRAKQEIYRTVVGAIEEEGERVGLDMSKLRQLNKKISTFAATRDAYADRALRAAEGHTTLGNLGLSTMLVGGGAVAGGIEGAIAGAAAEGARRVGMPIARGADFVLAKLVQASRNGSKPAQLGQMALQLGLSQEIADRIARGGIPGLYEEEQQPAGMIEPGNINLTNRPRVKNADGSISTVRSMGVNIDGQEVLIPTVSEDGRIMSDDEAVEQYKRTGRHLGKFETPDASTAYAERLHEDQAKLLGR